MLIKDVIVTLLVGAWCCLHHRMGMVQDCTWAANDRDTFASVHQQPLCVYETNVEGLKVLLGVMFATLLNTLTQSSYLVMVVALQWLNSTLLVSPLWFFYCFRILLVYPSALYYGMLILSRARGACPTPPENRVHVACSHFEWQKQWHLALWHDQNNGAFLFLTIWQSE